jgi:hypothetical protein
MTATQNALYDVVSVLADVTGWVGTYRSEVAVFTRSPIPPQVSGKYIVIRDALTDIPGVGETKETRGRFVAHDIALYKDANGDPSDLQDVAEAVRDALHRNQIPVSGYGNALIVKASGPVEADEDQVYGRIVTVSLELVKAR